MNLNRIIAPLKSRTVKFINQRRGWTTDRKIVVIESDDWGSIRMPSRDVYERSLKTGYRVDLNPFEKYDSLESEDDLELLFETLTKFKDINGNHPQITANSLVANPDFEEIASSQYQEYHYETIDKTFASYPKHANSINLWYEGEKEGVFFLQYHGREHFNGPMFMEALRGNREEAYWAAKNKMGGSIAKDYLKNRYVVASNFRTVKEMEEGMKNIKEGIQFFKKMHRKESKSYIATNYIWPYSFEKVLAEEGVRYLQGNYLQEIPNYNNGFDHKFHYLGEKNHHNQIYLIRNAIFEPSITNGANDVELCLKQIEKSFKLKKPVIISSHRINYMGFIFEGNRDKNLKQLTQLIKQVQKKWPDVEFMNTEQLGNLITTKTK